MKYLIYVILVIAGFILGSIFSNQNVKVETKTVTKIDTLIINKVITKEISSPPTTNTKTIFVPLEDSSKATHSHICDSLKYYTMNYTDDTLTIKYDYIVRGEKIKDNLYFKLNLKERIINKETITTKTVYNKYQLFGGVNIQKSPGIYLDGVYNNYQLGVQYNIDNSYSLKIGYRFVR